MKKYIALLAVFVVMAIILVLNLQKVPSLPNASTANVEQPNIPFKENSEQSPKSRENRRVEIERPQPILPKTTPPNETQEFLSLIARSNKEKVFSTPSRHVLATKVDGYWVAQGDLLISENQLTPETEPYEVRLALFNKINLWPNNTVPFYIDPSLDPNPILEAISVIHNYTNVRFTEQIDEEDFIFFKAAPGRVCQSYLGRKGGEQEIRIDPGYCRMGNILHEIMHALGFVHEHSRSDRDDYLNIHWDAIEAGRQGQFQKLSKDISLPYKVPPPFDFDSVMLYSSRSFAKGSAPTMTQKDGTQFGANRANLSFEDVKKINALYPADLGF